MIHEKSIALLFIADDGCLGDFMNTIYVGRTRLKEKHMRILSNRRKEPERYPEGFEPV